MRPLSQQQPLQNVRQVTEKQQHQQQQTPPTRLFIHQGSPHLPMHQQQQQRLIHQQQISSQHHMQTLLQQQQPEQGQPLLQHQQQQQPQVRIQQQNTSTPSLHQQQHQQTALNQQPTHDRLEDKPQTPLQQQQGAPQGQEWQQRMCFYPSVPSRPLGVQPIRTLQQPLLQTPFRTQPQQQQRRIPPPALQPTQHLLKHQSAPQAPLQQQQQPRMQLHVQQGQLQRWGCPLRVQQQPQYPPLLHKPTPENVQTRPRQQLQHQAGQPAQQQQYLPQHQTQRIPSAAVPAYTLIRADLPQQQLSQQQQLQYQWQLLRRRQATQYQPPMQLQYQMQHQQQVQQQQQPEFSTLARAATAGGGAQRSCDVSKQSCFSILGTPAVPLVPRPPPPPPPLISSPPLSVSPPFSAPIPTPPSEYKQRGVAPASADGGDVSSLAAAAPPAVTGAAAPPDCAAVSFAAAECLRTSVACRSPSDVAVVTTAACLASSSSHGGSSTSSKGNGMKVEDEAGSAVHPGLVTAAKVTRTQPIDIRSEPDDCFASRSSPVRALPANAEYKPKEAGEEKGKEKPDECTNQDSKAVQRCRLPAARGGEAASTTCSLLAPVSATTCVTAAGAETKPGEGASGRASSGPVFHDLLAGAAVATTAPTSIMAFAATALTPAVAALLETTAATPLAISATRESSASSAPAPVTFRILAASPESGVPASPLPSISTVEAWVLEAANALEVSPASLGAGGKGTTAGATKTAVSTSAAVATSAAAETKNLLVDAPAMCTAGDSATLPAAAVEGQAAAVSVTGATLTVSTLAGQSPPAECVHAARSDIKEQPQHMNKHGHAALSSPAPEEIYSKFPATGMPGSYIFLTGTAGGGHDGVSPSVLPREPSWNLSARTTNATVLPASSSVLQGEEGVKQIWDIPSTDATSTALPFIGSRADHSCAAAATCSTEAELPPRFTRLFGNSTSSSSGNARNDRIMTDWWRFANNDPFSLKSNLYTESSKQQPDEKHRLKAGQQEQQRQPFQQLQHHHPQFHNQIQQQQIREQQLLERQQHTQEKQQVQNTERQSPHERFFSIPCSFKQTGAAEDCGNSSEVSGSNNRYSIGNTNKLKTQTDAHATVVPRRKSAPAKAGTLKASAPEGIAEKQIEEVTEEFCRRSEEAATGKVVQRKRVVSEEIGEGAIAPDFIAGEEYPIVNAAGEGEEVAGAAAERARRDYVQYQNQQAYIMQYAQQRQKEHADAVMPCLSGQLVEDFLPRLTSYVAPPTRHIASDESGWSSSNSLRRRSRSRARRRRQREFEREQVFHRGNPCSTNRVEQVQHHACNCCGAARLSSRSATRRDHHHMSRERGGIPSDSSDSRYNSSSSSEDDDYYYCRRRSRKSSRNRDSVKRQGNLDQQSQRQLLQQHYCHYHQSYLRHQRRYSQQHARSSKTAVKYYGKLKKQLRAAVEATLNEHNSTEAAAALSAAYVKLIETLEGGEKQQLKPPPQQQHVVQHQQQDLQPREQQYLQGQHRLRHLRLHEQLVEQGVHEQWQTKVEEDEDTERRLQFQRQEVESDEEEGAHEERQPRTRTSAAEDFCDSFITHMSSRDEGASSMSSIGFSGKRKTSRIKLYGGSNRSCNPGTLQNSSNSSSFTAGSSENHGNKYIRKDEGLFRISISSWGSGGAECGEHQRQPQQQQEPQEGRLHCDLWRVKANPKGGFFFERETPADLCRPYPSTSKREGERAAAETSIVSQEYTVIGAGEDTELSSSSSTAATNRYVHQRCVPFRISSAVSPPGEAAEAHAASKLSTVRDRGVFLPNIGRIDWPRLEESTVLDAAAIPRGARIAAERQGGARPSRGVAGAARAQGVDPSDVRQQQIGGSSSETADQYFGDEFDRPAVSTTAAVPVSLNGGANARKGKRGQVPLLRLGALQKRCAAAAEAALSLAFCGQHPSLYQCSIPGHTSRISRTGKQVLVLQCSGVETAPGLSDEKDTKTERAGKRKDEPGEIGSPLISYRDLLLSEDMTPEKQSAFLSPHRDKYLHFQRFVESPESATVAASAATEADVEPVAGEANRIGAAARTTVATTGAKYKSARGREAEIAGAEKEAEPAGAKKEAQPTGAGKYAEPTGAGKEAEPEGARKKAEPAGPQKETNTAGGRNGKAADTGKTVAGVGTKVSAATRKKLTEAGKRPAVEGAGQAAAGPPAQDKDERHKVVAIPPKVVRARSQGAARQGSVSTEGLARTNSAAVLGLVAPALAAPTPGRLGIVQTITSEIVVEEEDAVAEGGGGVSRARNQGAAGTDRSFRLSTAVNTAAGGSRKTGAGIIGCEAVNIETVVAALNSNEKGIVTEKRTTATPGPEDTADGIHKAKEAAPALARAMPAISSRRLSGTAAASTVSSDEMEKSEREQRSMTQEQHAASTSRASSTMTLPRAIVPVAAAAAAPCGAASAAVSRRVAPEASSSAASSAAVWPATASAVPSVTAPAVSTTRHIKAGEVATAEQSGALMHHGKRAAAAGGGGEHSEGKVEYQLGNNTAATGGRGFDVRDASSRNCTRGRMHNPEKRMVPFVEKKEEPRRSWRVVPTSPSSKHYFPVASSFFSPSFAAAEILAKSGSLDVKGYTVAAAVTATSKQVTAQLNDVSVNSLVADADRVASGAYAAGATAPACGVHTKERGRVRQQQQQRKHRFQWQSTTTETSRSSSTGTEVRKIEDSPSMMSSMIRASQSQVESEHETKMREKGEGKKQVCLELKQKSGVWKKLDEHASANSRSTIIGGMCASSAFPPLSVSSGWRLQTSFAGSRAGKTAGAAGTTLGEADAATTGRATRAETPGGRTPGWGTAGERTAGKKEGKAPEAGVRMIAGGVGGRKVGRSARARKVVVPQPEHKQTAATGRVADILSGASHQRRRKNAFSGSPSCGSSIPRSYPFHIGTSPSSSSVAALGLVSPAAVASCIGCAALSPVSPLMFATRGRSPCVGRNNAAATAVCSPAALVKYERRARNSNTSKCENAIAVGPAAVVVERSRRSKGSGSRDRGSKLKYSGDRGKAKMHRSKDSGCAVTETWIQLRHPHLDHVDLQQGNQEHGKQEEGKVCQRTLFLPEQKEKTMHTEQQQEQRKEGPLRNCRTGWTSTFLKQQQQQEPQRLTGNKEQHVLQVEDEEKSKDRGESLQIKGPILERRNSCMSNKSNSRDSSTSRREWEALEEALALAAATEADEAAAAAEKEGVGQWKKVPTAAYLRKIDEVEDSELSQQYMLQYMLLQQQRRQQQQQHGAGDGSIAHWKQKSFSAAAAVDSNFAGATASDNSSRDRWLSTKAEKDTEGDEEEEDRREEEAKTKEGKMHKGKQTINGEEGKEERNGKQHKSQEVKRKKQRKLLLSAAAAINSVIAEAKAAAATTANDGGDEENGTQNEEEGEENLGCNALATAVALSAYQTLQNSENLLLPPRLLLHATAEKKLPHAVERAMSASAAVYGKALRQQQHPQKQQQQQHERGSGCCDVAADRHLRATADGLTGKFEQSAATLERRIPAEEGRAAAGHESELTREERAPAGGLNACAYVMFWPTAVEHLKPFLDTGMHQQTYEKEGVAETGNTKDSADGLTVSSAAYMPTSHSKQTQVRLLPLHVALLLLLFIVDSASLTRGHGGGRIEGKTEAEAKALFRCV